VRECHGIDAHTQTATQDQQSKIGQSKKEMEVTMQRTVTHRVRKSVLAFSLAMTLVGGLCLPGLAQHTTASNSLTGKSATGWSSLPLDAQRAIRTALAQDDSGWLQQAELTPSDAEGGEFFGTSVAVSGKTIVVGAFYETVGSNGNQGAAYVFAESDGAWTQQAELTASDGALGDYFGRSVAVSGNTIIVGAPDHTVGSNTWEGAAYIFSKDGGTWTQQAELTSSDGKAYDTFGISVAVDGSTAMVGASAHPASGQGLPGPGATYVFVRSGPTWKQRAELAASDGAAADAFGCCVAISSGTAIVGSPNHPFSTSPGPGSAYIFVGSGGTWSQQVELTAPDGAPYDQFGNVALDGGTAVVGASGHTVGSNTGQGAVYVFAQSGTTWSQQAELTASDGMAGDGLGFSVGVSDGTALAGANGHTVGSNPYQGAAYVFAQNGGTWTQQAELTASDGAAYDAFGWSAALSGNTAVMGAPCHISPNRACFPDAGPGATYVFVPATGTVTLTPASFTFWETKVGDNSAHKFTLKNSLPATLNGISYSTTGPFAVSTSTCGTTLDSGKNCTISVTFSPTETGTATGTLTVTDSASNSPQTVSLSGTGD
jgi:hypothetical protein